MSITLRKDKTPTAFRAEASGKSLSLQIYDVIGADMFGQGITASMVKASMDDQDDYDDIQVNLNSPGGDAFEGVAIYNVLKNSGKPVCVIVDGIAASAASIVAMAGDTITMGEGSMIMIHEAMALCAGFADDMRQMADTLDTVSASIADIYVSRTKNSKTSVLEMMKAETWMGAKDAVNNGFATAVAGKAKVSNSFDLSAFKNVPEELKNTAKTKEVDGEHLTAGDFIYVGDPDKTDTWSLPWHFSTDEKTKSHLRDALARFDQDEVIPEAHKPEAYAKLTRLCKEHGIEVSKSGKAKNYGEGVFFDFIVFPPEPQPEDYKLPLLQKQLEINKRK
jgi:ATP-dependent protease ClpP protease subunit